VTRFKWSCRMRIRAAYLTPPRFDRQPYRGWSCSMDLLFGIMDWPELRPWCSSACRCEFRLHSRVNNKARTVCCKVLNSQCRRRECDDVASIREVGMGVSLANFVSLGIPPCVSAAIETLPMLFLGHIRCDEGKPFW
jgi:hypothetical protein